MHDAPTGSLIKFIDEGPSVELRLALPKGCSAYHLSQQLEVQCTEESVVVTLSSSQGRSTLFSGRPLYGRIRPSYTTWAIDDDELVVHLQKAAMAKRGFKGGHQPGPWPSLVHDRTCMGEGVAEKLKSCSVYVVGDCGNRVKQGIAEELGRCLGYTPLCTEAVLAQVSGYASMGGLLQAEGSAAVAVAEAAVLESMSTNVRLVVASLVGAGELEESAVGDSAGGAPGASESAPDPRFRFLHGGFVVWVALRGSAPLPPEALHADAAVRIDAAEAEWESGSLLGVATEGVLKAIRAALDANADLAGKKSLYVRMGSRGDWPELMPPGWAPGV